MALSFYTVDKAYIDYLQSAELQARGFTHVPNMEYSNREQKFTCGIVLRIRDLNYYVPVSSYTKQQKDNILINISQDIKNPVKGSLRFNISFPICRTIDLRQTVLRLSLAVPLAALA